jgi:hypothetical protein
VEEAGADVNQAATTHGLHKLATSLYVSDQEGDVEVVRALVDNGVDLNHETGDDPIIRWELKDKKG